MTDFRLVTIGDSLTQGFMSGAISRTDISYPALLARALGLSVPRDFRVPSFPGSGLPLNIEDFLYFISSEVGSQINLASWISRFPVLLRKYTDEVEDLYERKAGSLPSKFKGIYHNLSVWGFTVHDALTVTSSICDAAIKEDEGFIEDDFLGIPSASMYRTAKRVLNPPHDDSRKDDTLVDSLHNLVKSEGAPNVLCLFLGANDCLGTVLTLDVKDMAEHSGDVPSDPLERRRLFNLTSAGQFAIDYKHLTTRIADIVGKETEVFVGTVPHVTIPPVTTGIPPKRGDYYEHYARFFIDEENFSKIFNASLTRDEATTIDDRIDAFNGTIHKEVAARGDNWHIVDTCDVLDRLAVKRNDFSVPGNALKAYYTNRPDHPLLALDPVPSILMLETTEHGKRTGGGLMSLDGVHPSTIGYGVVAELFLCAMKDAGVVQADPLNLDWSSIIAQDTLLQAPPPTWDDIDATAAQWPVLADLIFRVIAGRLSPS